MTAQPVPARRLLMVVNELESFFNHRLPIARGARAAGWDVHVAMADAAQARARDVDGLAFHTVPLTRSFAAPHREAAGSRRSRVSGFGAERLAPSFGLGRNSHPTAKPPGRVQ